MKNIHVLSTEEVWKDVIGYKELYQVSNFGNVKSLDREVAENYSEYNEQINKAIQEAVKFGAKWQEERMYSEEDMKEFGKFLLELANSAMSKKTNMKMLDLKTGKKLVNDLFEQFKNK